MNRTEGILRIIYFHLLKNLGNLRQIHIHGIDYLLQKKLSAENLLS